MDPNSYALAFRMPTEEIEAAIDEGIRQYWSDGERQSAAFKAWKDRGFEGKCEQHSHGSLADYVKRAVRAIAAR